MKIKRRGFYFRHGLSFARIPCPAEIQIPLGKEGAEVCEIADTDFCSPTGGIELGWSPAKAEASLCLGACLQPHVQKVWYWQPPAETRSRDSQAAQSFCQGTPKCHIQLLTLHSVGRGRGWQVMCEVLSQCKCHSQRSSESVTMGGDTSARSSDTGKAL